MSKIKVREITEKTIKKIDKKLVSSEKYKENIVNAKDKDNSSSVSEYSSNKMESGFKTTNKLIKNFNKKGFNEVKDTKKNIVKVKNKIKQLKAKMARRKTRKNIKKGKTVLVKGSKKTIKTSGLAIKKTVKAPKKIIVIAKRVINTIKTVIKAIKAFVSGVKAVISAIVAGGWIAVIIVVAICLIAFLFNSVFGIFFSNENVNDKTMSIVISELNNELAERINTIQNANPHDDYVLNLNRADWKYILAIYTVIVSNGNDAANVVTIDENKTNILKEVFWKMNVITYNVQEEVDESDNIKKILYINIDGKNVNDMIVEYNLDAIQQKQMNELLLEKYDSMWSKVVYNGNLGNSNVVSIALSQVGITGGEPYWRWYGFNSRVEWCAIFVSWVYNQAGYLNISVPKFSVCHTQGMPWFKSLGLWRDREYVPKAGDVIFFDWEQDGHVDHVGIVENSDGKKVYTIEGNSRDQVKQKKYSIDSKYIYGYGIPKY